MGKLPLVEQFYSLQGEGRHTGRAAYFIRLGGCDAACSWCDARFTWSGGELTDVQQIVNQAIQYKAQSIVITGGEPTLYDLTELTSTLHNYGVEIFIETNGSNPIQGHFDWICLSPKEHQPPLEENYKVAGELKVVIQTPQDLVWAERVSMLVGDNCLLYLQPEWGRRVEITPVLIDYIKQYPKWRLSIQTHKFLNIP